VAIAVVDAQKHSHAVPEQSEGIRNKNKVVEVVA